MTETLEWCEKLRQESEPPLLRRRPHKVVGVFRRIIHQKRVSYLEDCQMKPERVETQVNEIVWSDDLDREQDHLIMKRLDEGLNDQEKRRLEELKMLHEAHLNVIDRELIGTRLDRIEDLIAEFTALRDEMMPK